MGKKPQWGVANYMHILIQLSVCFVEYCDWLLPYINYKTAQFIERGITFFLTFPTLLIFSLLLT